MPRSSIPLHLLHQPGLQTGSTDWATGLTWILQQYPPICQPSWYEHTRGIYRNQNLHLNNVIFQGIIVAIPIPGPLEGVPAMAAGSEWEEL